MKFAIFADMGSDKPMILGTRDGVEVWKDSLEEMLDFIQEYDICIYENTYIAEVIPEKSGKVWVLHEYRKKDIEDLLTKRAS